MAGESYTSPVTGETYTVPSYTDPADAPIAFKDFADTITGGGGIDIPATRVDAVVQTLDGSTWAEGMALSVVAEVPADSEGQVGDVVFVSGKSPAPLGAAKLSAITGSGITHTYGDFVAFEFQTNGSFTCTEGLIPQTLVVGAGGGGGGSLSAEGGGGGGGGGRVALYENALFVAGSSNVVIGEGGAGTASAAYRGGYTTVDNFLGTIAFSLGGGGGASGRGVIGNAVDGSSGGGGGWVSNPSDGVPGMGFDGAPATGMGAGGAAGGGAGNTPDPATPKVGGVGISLGITGSVVEYGTGGSSDIAPSPTPPNLGTGGGSGYAVPGEQGGSGVVIIKVKASNAANVDKSGWTEVTEAMLAAAAKKREVERKAQAKKAALLAKTEELSGATQTDIEETK